MSSNTHCMLECLHHGHFYFADNFANSVVATRGRACASFPLFFQLATFVLLMLLPWPHHLFHTLIYYAWTSCPSYRGYYCTLLSHPNIYNAQDSPTWIIYHKHTNSLFVPITLFWPHSCTLSVCLSVRNHTWVSNVWLNSDSESDSSQLRVTDMTHSHSHVKSDLPWRHGDPGNPNSTWPHAHTESGPLLSTSWLRARGPLPLSDDYLSHLEADTSPPLSSSPPPAPLSPPPRSTPTLSLVNVPPTASGWPSALSPEVVNTKINEPQSRVGGRY